jgi:serine/threonine protein kinase
VKLADFGLSATYKPNISLERLTHKCGTIAFMAPEVAFDKDYTKVSESHYRKGCGYLVTWTTYVHVMCKWKASIT